MTDTEKDTLCARIDELCAEVERLHGEIRLNPLECALSEAQAFRGQVAALRAENAKLRTLVVWLLEYSNDLDSCEGCEVVAECETEENTDPYGFPIACVAYERIAAEAEALGIEVRHG